MGKNQQSRKPAQRVRIIDLAEHLNLAKGTVSRALNDYPDISDKTKVMVRRAAEEAGYRPLTHAQAIRTGRVRSIGLVLQDNEHDGHRPFVADFLAGLTEAASREDWTLTVATASNDEDTLRLLHDLTEQRKADGFILPRTKLDDPRIEYLRENGIPFVLFGQTGDPADCAWFDIDSEAAMHEAVTRLAALGHKSIALVSGADGYSYTRLRMRGYKSGLAQAGLPFDPARITRPAVCREEGAAVMREMLDRDQTITAFLYSVDHAALGAYEVARARRLQIGRDISVISYDGIPEGALMDPPLSTFAVDTRAAGARLADMLINRCRGIDPGALRSLGHATFLDRGSHGPAPAL